MIGYFHTMRHFMRIPVGVNMRTSATTKKSVNVSLAPELLDEARKQNINLSALLTEALLEKFRENQRRTWLQENQQAIDALNQLVDNNGSFSDFQRTF
ncbi:type II toxin-antitoxin system CcdA family antitoxin [Atlantibacter subterranea]|uniref:type II toxin-antitoxin system CcdA family antitoxin n=1 Tax=Atlantibacter subterraneus TaxID=255519 RepID=UPI0020C366EF|nr:type II toxin-antitoxin system CcdA family antitoxin [Atlantibacter subterranea]UTJ47216.1 type II toxin-antitoxin system CcdA family antitoxin [Atlantibacter subterranea]